MSSAFHQIVWTLQPRPMIYLTTERLILRDWQASDLDAWAAINADPDVRRHLGDGTPADRKDPGI